MRPGFQPQAYITRPEYYPQTYHRSPPSRSNNNHYDHHQSYSHHPMYYADSNIKKPSTSLKNIEDKSDISDMSIKKKSIKTQVLTTFQKTQSNRDHPLLSNQSNHDTAFSMKKEETETELRTSCPNIFKRYQQNSLRNTMHTNNYPKFNNITVQSKKPDEQQKKIKKTLPEPTTPTPRIQNTNAYLKKNGMEKTIFKSRSEVTAPKLPPKQKERKNQINGFEIKPEPLGKGKFGAVYLARHIRTGFVVALKKIIKAMVKEHNMIEQFKRQICLHSSLDHPNIVKFYGFFEHEDNIYLILEYISGGTLFDYMAEKDILPPKQAVQYLKDTVQALTYLHDRSIAHRDIKPENIVLTVEKVAKLCDFGWSTLVQSSRTTYCGTFSYAPPEILERKNYDEAVDIWCVGVLTYEMLTGRVPFEGQKRKQIMEKIVSVDKNRIYYPISIPEEARNFIECLVQKDPNLRPKCKDLRKHPFFVKYSAKKNQNI